MIKKHNNRDKETKKKKTTSEKEISSTLSEIDGICNNFKSANINIAYCNKKYKIFKIYKLVFLR